jgi:hypothetical protein
VSKPKLPKTVDPCEEMVRRALVARGIEFIEEGDKAMPVPGLDFYIPAWEVYLELKQFHSPRISDQMARADNVIAIQGKHAAYVFSCLIKSQGLMP